MPPAAVNNIPASIFIMENILIDRLGSIMKLIDQWLSEIIFERTLGSVGNCYSNATVLFVTLNIVGTKKYVVFIIFFYNSRCPDRFIGPFHISSVQYAWMFFPVHQIRRRKCIEENLLFIWSGISR